MKYFLLAAFLFFSLLQASGQNLNRVARVKALHSKFASDDEKYNYIVKYSAALVPYVEVSFVNDKGSTAITTFVITVRMTVKGENYVDDVVVQKTIPRGAKGTFNVKLSDKYLRRYKRPEDLEVNDVIVHNIRFADGTVKSPYMLLAKRQ